MSYRQYPHNPEHNTEDLAVVGTEDFLHKTQTNQNMGPNVSLNFSMHFRPVHTDYQTMSQVVGDVASSGFTAQVVGLEWKRLPRVHPFTHLSSTIYPLLGFGVPASETLWKTLMAKCLELLCTLDV